MSKSRVTHLSQVLWRFYRDSVDKSALGIIASLISSDKLKLKPYPEIDAHYIRKIFLGNSPSSNMFLKPDGEINEVAAFDVIEKKGVCFCDIPIDCLDSHFKKYGNVGFGIRRDILLKKAQDIQPVRYHYLKDRNSLNTSVEGVFEIDANQIKLNDFSKIPTILTGEHFNSLTESIESDLYSVSESFQSIYEEREWRFYKEAQFSLDEIAFFLVPDRKTLRNNSDFMNKIGNHPGLIFIEDLF